ncbi:MAG: hypothetical protein IKC05_03810 [Lentisphaeria bacterium]|nr:hypothetical protein [Lentisphaeria bacterium]
MKKYILPFVVLCLLLGAFLIRLFSPGVAAVWPVIYALLGTAVLLAGIHLRDKKYFLVAAQVVFAFFIALTMAEILFQSKIRAELRSKNGLYMTLPGNRIWWDCSGSKTVVRNGRELPLLSGTEAFAPGSNGMVFNPHIRGLHRSRRLLPGGKSVVTFEAEYTINEHGFRKVPFLSKNAELPPLLFFGDSFTFGEGVNDDEVYVNLISEKLKNRRNVYNFGIPGKDPADFLYYLKSKHLERSGLKGNLNARGFYLIINDHKYRVIHTHGNSEYRYFSQKDRAARFICYWLRERILYKSAVSDAIFNKIYNRRYLLYLQQAKAFLAKKYSSDLTIVIYPDCSTGMIKELADAGFKLLFLKEYMPDYKGYHSRKIDLKYEIPYDGHPTPATHKLIAQAVLDYLTSPPDTAAVNSLSGHSRSSR